jgi:hypothetical protein
LVARFASTRDCFGSLMRVSRSIHAAIPSHIELVHFPEGTDDDTIVRVIDGSPRLRDVVLLEIGDAAVDRACVRLARLKKLVIIANNRVRRLPDSLCGNNLRSRLTFLRVSSNSLEELPELIGQLSSLDTLNLEKCRNLAALPESTGQLSSLATLNLRCCFRLAALPESISQLSSLATQKPRELPSPYGAPRVDRPAPVARDAQPLVLLRPYGAP